MKYFNKQSLLHNINHVYVNTVNRKKKKKKKINASKGVVFFSLTGQILSMNEISQASTDLLQFTSKTKLYILKCSQGHHVPYIYSEYVLPFRFHA